MDFARPLVSTPSVASQSKIRHLDAIPVDDETTSVNNAEQSPDVAALDNKVIAAANRVAREMFMGDDSNDTVKFDPAQHAWILDASRYTERSTPIIHNGLVQGGDLVVIQESFDKLDFVYVQPGAIFQNRNGAFHHADFINQPFGTKIRSRDQRGYGFLYLLKPTPELWTRSLNHRTQVVHELDQSQIVFQLHVQPNSVVVESGTGSGAMSHALLRTIAPRGHLHTYEFNQHRAQEAQREFDQHGLRHLVTVHHKDVCHGLEEDQDSGKKTMKSGKPGFDLPGQTVDAVFLDLPEPWWAVPHAAFVLIPNGRIASYSPCVEQTQRTIQALEACGFHSIKTLEYRLMEHYVDEVAYESPPRSKRPRIPPHNVNTYTTTVAPVAGADEGDNGVVVGDDADEAMESNAVGSRTELSELAEPTNNGPLEQHVIGHQTPVQKVLVARPFVSMRGHSAFLTFATAGLAPQPDPNTVIQDKG
jgi:tRNA (adenine57-N1/adenine58-N1)-methyltransferase catalytic subunit